ncbi:MAG: 50S ribosomal protein L14 [Candidatus Altiarchaeales archaeon IMC4]|nr:MAG: 50S ribosomal protein L14 [Candidatus Altiarchaeales archaeon IMC4]
MKNLPLGKAITAKMSKPIPTGGRLVCADNSGAKELELVAVRGFKGVLNRMPAAGVGDMIIVSVKKGRPDIRKQVLKAVIIRQKKEYTRYDGTKIKFDDNAAVIVGDDGLPKGTEIKGAVAREATERWSKIGTIASIVI